MNAAANRNTLCQAAIVCWMWNRKYFRNIRQSTSWVKFWLESDFRNHFTQGWGSYFWKGTWELKIYFSFSYHYKDLAQVEIDSSKKDLIGVTQIVIPAQMPVHLLVGEHSCDDRRQEARRITQSHSHSGQGSRIVGRHVVGRHHLTRVLAGIEGGYDTESHNGKGAVATYEQT